MLASIATSVRHGSLGTTSPDLVRPRTDPLTVATATATAAAMRPDAG
ncbi:hypothetical protein ACIRF8_18720 [Streptomyces sp. NPDC102406]